MKNLKTIVTLLALLSLFIISTEANKKGQKKKQRSFMKCLGGDVKMPSTMFKAILSCPIETKGENEKKAKAFWGRNSNVCWQTCVWKNLGWINGENKLNLAAVKLMVDEIFPAKAVENIKGGLDACSKDPITIEEKGCLSLDSMKQCFMNAIKNVCKTSIPAA